MTTKLRGYGSRFIGLAADPKPVLEANSTRVLAPGCEYYELDTHTNYIFDGTGTWYVAPLLTTSSV